MADLADDFRERIDAHGDVARDDRRQRRRAALEGNGDDFYVGHVFQQLARQMRRGAVAGHAVGEQVRLLARRGEHVLEFCVRALGGDDDRERRGRDLTDRGKIL